MKILDLVLKDLRQILHDKNSALFLVAMPIVFTFFMGYAYRSGELSAADERIPLAWVEKEPVSELSSMLFNHLQDGNTFEVTRMELDAAQNNLKRGKVDGILVIPTDFDQKVQENKDPQLTLIADTTSTTGQSVYQLLRTPVSQLISSLEIGHLSAENLDDPNEFMPAVNLAWKKWASYNLDALVRLEQASGQQEESWFGDNPYNQASPGIIVQFAIIGLVTSGQVLMQERKTRTLQRLMTTCHASLANHRRSHAGNVCNCLFADDPDDHLWSIRSEGQLSACSVGNISHRHLPGFVGCIHGFVDRHIGKI